MYQQVSMPTVWIDLENTPHVPFFGPIIRTLEQRGIEVILTARDFAQTVALLERNQMTAMVIGGEYGKDTLSKILGLSARALTLRTKLKEQQIDLAIGHGSRGLLLASKLMRISSLTMYDYEGASVGFFNKFSTLVLTPEVVGKALLQKHRISPKKLRTYPGIKEDVYAGELKPDGSIYRALGLDPRKIIVTIRPPSDTAHYRSDQSQQLFDAIVQLLTQREDIEMLISARTRDQRQRLSTTYKDRPNIHIPETAFDGLNLLYHSDLVVGGGGTMNREAAALEVPVANIFKGAQGAIDAALVNSGKMVDITSAAQVIAMLKKRTPTLVDRHSPALASICNTIQEILASR
jgi:predicted glycosyltransferase